MSNPQRDEVLRRLDIQMEFEKYGVRIAAGAQVNANGWIAVHSLYRADTHPSAAINIGTDPGLRGIYVDFGERGNGGKPQLTKSLFDVAAEFGPFMTGKDAYYRYARDGGVVIGGPPTKKGKGKDRGKVVVAAYDYHDAAGALLFQVCRMNPKSFKQRRPDGKGDWIWDLKGVEPVPYHLPEVIPAALVWNCEGEKDVDRLRALGLVATCNPMGAGKWRPGYNPYFQGKVVAIIPDNDLPGLTHAQDVARNLHGIAASVKIVELPGLPVKGDVSDWLDAGGTPEQLRTLMEAAPEWDPAQAPAPDKIAPTPSHDCGYTYTIYNRRHCLVVSYEGGVEYKPLCNFTAQITDEITRDDGLRITKEFIISGDLSGLSLPPAKVVTKEFDPMGWVRREWGAAASITPTRNNAAHLPNALLSHSRAQGIERRTLYAHTGWRQINGAWRYLHGAGAIGQGDPVAVDLGENLQLYRLPEPGGVDAAQASLRFLDLGPWEIMAPLWACVYLAPFADLLKVDFTLWLHGHTGGMKSTLAALALAHFGDFTRLRLPGSWFSTANSIEQLTYTLKDTICVIDDFNPPSNQKESHVMAEKAGRIIYQAGNRSARGRLGPDLTARPNYYPRSMLISTGEMLLPGQRQSATARYLGIELDPKKNQIDKDKLTVCQGEQHFYPAAMAAYLEHMALDLDDNVLMIQDMWEGNRKAFQNASQHLRIPEILAWLATGFELGLKFQTSMGAITPDQSYDMLNRAWRVFKGLGEKHSQILRDDQVTVKFMAVLRELFIQGRVYVESSSLAGAPPPQDQRSLGWLGTSPEHNAEMMGWADETTLYLLPETTVKVVKEAIRRQGAFMSIGKREILAALVRDGISEPDIKRKENTKIKKVGGICRRIIYMNINELIDKGEVEGE